MGRRLILLAESMGIPTSDPSEVTSLIIAKGRADIEADARLVGGFANVLATAFGKQRGTEWFESLQPPHEAERLKRARAERDELLRTKAMLNKIQMMSARYEIQEVRE